MNADQTISGSVAKVLLVGGIAVAVALSCGRTDLVGSGPPDALDGAGGSSGTCGNANGGGPASGGGTGYGGYISTGGTPYVDTGDKTGQDSASVSCPTISTTPGALNPCGRTIGIAYSPDGQLLATATETNKPNIHIWRLSDGTLVRDIEGPGDTAYAVAFSPDGTMLATAGTATTTPGPACVVPAIDLTAEVKLWDVATGNFLRTVPTSTGSYAYTVRFSHDGNRLVTAGGAGSIEIWNTSDPTAIGTDASLLGTINVTNTYYDVQFSPDDTRIVGAGAGVGGVWNVSDASLAFSLNGWSDDMNDAAYSPDGTEIAATGADGVLRFLDASGNFLQSFVAHTVNYTSRVVWVDNDHVVSDDWGGNIKSWTRGANNQFGASGSWSLGSQAFGIAVSPDGTTLAVGGDGGFMFISYAPVAPAVVRLP
jgi:WD40 repeat protein